MTDQRTHHNSTVWDLLTHICWTRSFLILKLKHQFLGDGEFESETEILMIKAWFSESGAPRRNFNACLVVEGDSTGDSTVKYFNTVLPPAHYQLLKNYVLHTIWRALDLAACPPTILWLLWQQRPFIRTIIVNHSIWWSYITLCECWNEPGAYDDCPIVFLWPDVGVSSSRSSSALSIPIPNCTNSDALTIARNV